MKESKFYRVIEWIFAIVVMVILVVDLVLDNRFYYVCKNNCPVPNVVFVAVILAFLALVFFIAGRVNDRNSSRPQHAPREFHRLKKILGILTLLLFAAQIVYAAFIYFETGWDCRSLVTMAQSLCFDGASIGNDHYFSIYPNNVFLTGIFAGILKAVFMCGINSDYFPLIIFGALLVSLSGYFMADCVRVLTGRKSLMIGAWVVFVLLTGLSPWVSIPYSDTYSIFFPTFAVWLFLTGTDKNYGFLWFFITLTCFVGYFIKPTVLLTFMVLVFFEVFHFICGHKSERTSNRIKKALFTSLAVVLGVVISLAMRTGMEKITGFEPDETRSFTPMHYLMMGANAEYGGGYNQTDVNLSYSYETVDERNEKDLAEAIKRYKDMFPARIISFEAQKCLTNFNDGTFAWGNEGDFYWTYYETGNPVALGIRSYVYHIGENHGAYVAFTQFWWMFVLCASALMIIKGRKYSDYRETAVCVCFLAIIVFLTVFEARARYLYLYSPIIYMVASLGFNRLLLERKLKKND